MGEEVESRSAAIGFASIGLLLMLLLLLDANSGDCCPNSRPLVVVNLVLGTIVVLSGMSIFDFARGRGRKGLIEFGACALVLVWFAPGGALLFLVLAGLIALFGVGWPAIRRHA